MDFDISLLGTYAFRTVKFFFWRIDNLITYDVLFIPGNIPCSEVCLVWSQIVALVFLWIVAACPVHLQLWTEPWQTRPRSPHSGLDAVLWMLCSGHVLCSGFLCSGQVRTCPHLGCGHSCPCMSFGPEPGPHSWLCLRGETSGLRDSEQGLGGLGIDGGLLERWREPPPVLTSLEWGPPATGGVPWCFSSKGSHSHPTPHPTQELLGSGDMGLHLGWMFLALTWVSSGFPFTALTLCTSQLVLYLSFYLDLPFTPHQYTTMVTKCVLLPFLGGFTKKKKDKNVLSTPGCSSERLPPPSSVVCSQLWLHWIPAGAMVRGGEGGFYHRMTKSPSFSHPVTL